MKRVALFIVTNLAVMLVLGLAVNLLGLNRFLTANGLNLPMLLGFSLIFGFGGAIISLLISKPMAKWSSRAQVINDSTDSTHRWIVATVKKFADKAGIGMPEVAIFEGAPNAFATGAFKNSALVAVSTGLLQSMTKEEVEAVIGHEVAHIANGDMVTMTLIQGVMNTFVVFLSRAIGYFVDRVVLRQPSRPGDRRITRISFVGARWLDTQIEIRSAKDLRISAVMLDSTEYPECPYFDGGMTEDVNVDDFLWEGEEDSSVSYYYFDRVVRTKWLCQRMGTVVPVSRPFQIFFGSYWRPFVCSTGKTIIMPVPPPT